MTHDARHLLRRSLAGLLLAALVAGCDSAGAYVPESELRPSAIVVVANADDAGPGSLRAAIADAYVGDVITFDPALAGATIELASELVVDKSLTVVGPDGGITISGMDAARVFHVFPVYQVVLEGLTITRGLAPGSSAFAEGFGGAILNRGNLTVKNSTIRDSAAELAGGGVATVPGSTLALTNVTVAGNTSQRDGGGLLVFGADVSIVNGTVSGNAAIGGGGGIFVVNATETPASVALAHATIAANGADAGGGIRGSSNGVAAVEVTLANSIVADNLSNSASAGPDVFMPSLTSLTATFSLVGTTEGHGLTDGVDGNLVGVSPGFVLDGFGIPALADHGGPTPTHALTAASPALDVADATACAAAPVNGLDQRGVARPQGAGCDMGAFEFVADVPPPPVEVSAVALAASGTVDKATGVANLAGTVTCTAPGSVTLTVALDQEQKVRRVSTTVVGSTTVAVPCDGVTAWAAAVTAENGVFVNGSATATAEAPGFGVPAASETVRLGWSR